MATLTAWKFPSPTGADDALAMLERLQKEELITSLSVERRCGRVAGRRRQPHGANDRPQQR
jgi:hypothetical protein